VKKRKYLAPHWGSSPEKKLDVGTNLDCSCVNISVITTHSTIRNVWIRSVSVTHPAGTRKETVCTYRT
jgi:hypothetical protein